MIFENKYKIEWNFFTTKFKLELLSIIFQHHKNSYDTKLQKF